MTNLLRVPVFCMCLAMMTILPGCSKKSDNWLIGEWIYDATATKTNLPPNIKAKGVPDMMAEKMGTQLVTQLMDQMKDVKFHITADKFTSVSANGIKNTHSYKITERPDANTIVIESEEPATFIKSGKHICIPSTGAVEFMVYFKPVN